MIPFDVFSYLIYVVRSETKCSAVMDLTLLLNLRHAFQTLVILYITSRAEPSFSGLLTRK